MKEQSLMKSQSHPGSVSKASCNSNQLYMDWVSVVLQVTQTGRKFTLARRQMHIKIGLIRNTTVLFNPLSG